MDYTIVFILGLFGSMEEDVIKGTGDFSFGPTEKVKEDLNPYILK